MIFPPFLKPQDLIGVTAPSAGIAAEDHAAFDLSLSRIRAMGYRVCETASVRSGGIVSAAADVRANELSALLRDPAVSMVWCASGGDFLLDMLPFVDFEAAVKHPKWVQGYSDPTSLLYTLTTRHDIATVYGANAGGFDEETIPAHAQYALNLLGGTLPPQHSFETFTHRFRDEGEQAVVWETPRGDFSATGRLLGGCLDCLSDILGTPYDGTADFVERYRADGIVWYFDIFALSAEATYRTLWRMRECGWFDTARAVMVGRVCFPSSFMDLSYREMIEQALPDVPLVLEADVGHVPPRMTMINGALATLEAKDGKGTLTMRLEE